MRLTFPNGEHPDVVEAGRITLGSGSDSRVRLPGLADRHAVIANDRRGLWLVIESSEASAHVNARPVSRLALVRYGDLISLGNVQVLLRVDTDPAEARLPAAGSVPPPASPGGPQCPERFVLRGVSGAHCGQSFPLSEAVVVGRGDAASLRLDDPTIADRQASVELLADRVLLRDLHAGKGEGTVLNGVRVRNAVLCGGDQLAWEGNRYVLEAPGLSAPVQRHDTTPLPRTRVDAAATTQTMRPIPAAVDAAAAVVPTASRKLATVWWLIVAAALLGGALTALLVYAPRLSH